MATRSTPRTFRRWPSRPEPRPRRSPKVSTRRRRPRRKVGAAFLLAVARGGVAKDLEHRGGRRERDAGSGGGRDDVTDWRLRMELADRDVVADRLREGELRDQRDADAGGDQPLHGQVIVGLERDPRLESGGAAGAKDVPGAVGRLGRLDPGLIRKVIERDRLLSRQPMALGKSQLHRVLEQRCRTEAGSELARSLELEDQAEVEFPGPEARRELLGLALNQAEADGRIR